MQSGLEQVVEGGDNVVSFQSELPLALQQAMVQFIERHPNWDQYRLVQAALAGFLVQNGIESREITRVYVGNMFRRESLLHGARGRQQAIRISALKGKLSNSPRVAPNRPSTLMPSSKPKTASIFKLLC